MSHDSRRDGNKRLLILDREPGTDQRKETTKVQHGGPINFSGDASRIWLRGYFKEQKCLQVSNTATCTLAWVTDPNSWKPARWRWLNRLQAAQPVSASSRQLNRSPHLPGSSASLRPRPEAYASSGHTWLLWRDVMWCERREQRISRGEVYMD